MSLRASTVVWAESRHKGSALLLMLALADYAHDDGTNAFPSVRTLSKKTRLTPRGVQLLLHKLRVSGEIEAMGEHASGAVVYRLVLPGFAMGGEKFSPPRARGAKPASSSPEAGFVGGANGASPEPSVNPHQPSEGDHLARLVAIQRRYGWPAADFLALVQEVGRGAPADEPAFYARVEREAAARRPR